MYDLVTSDQPWLSQVDRLDHWAEMSQDEQEDWWSKFEYDDNMV